MAAGIVAVSMTAPAFSSTFAASCSRANTSGAMPSPASSPMMPIRNPSTPRSSTSTSDGAGDGMEVESSGSCPPMTSSSNAASCTVVANGPIWSSDDAKATSP